MMKRYLLSILLAVTSAQLCWAETEPFAGLQLAKAPINLYDKDAIKRGAKFFATNCASCHTLNYLRYDPVAKEAGIAMDRKAIAINGAVPPDLSLETDVRGADWVYTYLHSFYKDSSRPSGVNNLVFQGTAMPAILAPYQGEQVLVEHPGHDLLGHVEWYDLVKPLKEGTMPAADFDKAVDDLINFLTYAAAPYRAEQESLGYWVLGFLTIMFVLMYMLKKEYWKDVKKPNDDK